jgi:SAM-dependent methyltransferase
MPSAEQLALIDSYPILSERTSSTGFERHYFHVSCWASRRISASGLRHHVDVGSDHRMLGVLAAFLRVTFIDIRPLTVAVKDLQPLAGDILHLPLATNSVASLSCLHAAEHIGLGRYGDALNPSGTRKATEELIRVLAPGGNLYFALPVGRPRVEFNAQRIHAPSQILAYFAGMELAGFAVEDDAMHFYAKASPEDFEDADYACGMFWFRKPPASGRSREAYA